MSVQACTLRDGVAGGGHASQAFLFLRLPHTAVWKIYPAGIHSEPSGCDILYLLLRSSQPAGKTVPLSGHYKSTAAWSLQRRAKPWQAGGGAVNECFQSGMFQCGALD